MSRDILDNDTGQQEKETWERRLNYYVWGFTLLAIIQFIGAYRSLIEDILKYGLFHSRTALTIVPLLLNLVGVYLLSQSKKMGWILLTILTTAGSLFFLGTAYVMYDYLVYTDLLQFTNLFEYDVFSFLFNSLVLGIAALLLLQSWMRRHLHIRTKELTIALSLASLAPILYFFNYIYQFL